MGQEEEILKTNLFPIDVNPSGRELSRIASGDEESLIELCRRIRTRLETDHIVCPEAKAREISQAIRTPESAVRAVLGEGFYRLFTIEASRGLDDDGGFDQIGRFLPYVRDLLYTSFGVDPTDNFHPEQVSQVLKDEPRSLFCFLDAQHIAGPEVQRLRIFTQDHHRVLICATSPSVNVSDATPLKDGKSEQVCVHGPHSAIFLVAEDRRRDFQIDALEMESDKPEGHFSSWDKFLDAFYEPIRTALGSIPFVGEDWADDLAQSFFMKLYERDILEKRSASRGPFRNWLYGAAHHHAVDEWRKSQRRSERFGAFEAEGASEPHIDSSEDAPFDADEFYALSVLRMSLRRVQKYLLDDGKSEHWMIFEELVIAPLIRGRVPKTRDELLAMFPGQSPVFIDDRLTTVKRVFRRILPALIPADPTESLTPEERFTELLEILRASKNSRLWLTVLANPESSGASLDLTSDAFEEEMFVATHVPAVLHDELGVLLRLWLEMPMHSYLEDLEDVGPTVAAAIRDSRSSGPLRGYKHACEPLNLESLIARTDPRISAIPPEELIILLGRLKTFAKRVHRSQAYGARGTSAFSTTRRDNSMPFEVAQVFYDLAGSLALCRCDARIIGLSDERCARISPGCSINRGLIPDFVRSFSTPSNGSAPRSRLEPEFDEHRGCPPCA